MKKTGKSLLVIVMCFVLTACGLNASNSDETLSGTASEIIEQVYEMIDTGVAAETIEIDLEDSEAVEKYIGLENAELITDAAASVALISSLKYYVAVVRVNDPEYTKVVAQAMRSEVRQKARCNGEKEKLSVAGYEDVILLALVGEDLSESVTSAQLVEAFQNVCSGELTFQL